MNSLKRRPLSTFKELDPDALIKEPTPLDVVFVHGLQSRGTAEVRQHLKIWLREIRRNMGCRVWRFGFDGQELMADGRPRLMVLAGNLLQDIQRLPGNPPIRSKQQPVMPNRARKLVFIGHGAAGWIIEEALAWYSSTSTQTAMWTTMVILWSLPHIKDEAALNEYLEKYLKLYPGSAKGNGRSTEKLNQADSVQGNEPDNTLRARSSLKFELIEIIQDNFKRLVASPFGPHEKHVTISKVRKQESPGPRRETNETSGSNSTDSSNASGQPITSDQLSWDIGFEDTTHADVARYLRKSLSIEKSAEMLSKPHDRLEFRPSALKYGRFDANMFRRTSTGFSSRSSIVHLYPRTATPIPHPPEKANIEDSSSKIPHSGNSHLGSSQSTPLTSSTTSSSGEDILVLSTSGPSQETSDTPVVGDTAIKNDEPSVEQVDSPQTEPSQRKIMVFDLPPATSRNLLELAVGYQQSGDIQKSKALYERVIEMLAPDPALAGAINAIRLNIAVTSLYEGHLKAAQKVFRELEAMVEAPGNKQPTWPWEAKRWLAVSFDMQGLYEIGREKLIDINRALSSFQPTTEVAFLSRSTLALVFGHLGKYGQALKRSEAVLLEATESVKRAQERAKSMDGEKGSAFVTRQRGALGSIQYDRATILTFVGQYDKAETMNSQALDNIQRSLGSNHVSTLDCLSLRARHFAATRRLTEAESQCQNTLKTMRKEIGKEHPSTLKTLGILVYVYRLQARLTEALDTAKYLWNKCKESEALGRTHPETINSMWQLAEVYIARGDLTYALHLQAEVVKIADNVLGKVHPTVLNYKACLARFYCDRGSWTLSATLSFDVFKDYRSAVSDGFQNGPESAKDQDEPRSERIGRARPSTTPMIQQALDKARTIFIEDKPDFETLNFSLVSTLQCLGVTERERLHGDLEIAQVIQSKANEYLEMKLGLEHPDVLTSKLDLALTKLKIGRKDALLDLENVTAALKRVLGEDHPDTLVARHHLSVAKFSILKDRADLREQAKVLRLCIHLLGDEHPTTNLARVDLSKAYRLLGMLEDAEELRLTALRVQVKTLPQPELTGPAKITYEQALAELAVKSPPRSKEEEIKSEPIEVDFEESFKLASPHCHAQVISSIAALALIYVDIGQSLSPLHDTNLDSGYDKESRGRPREQHYKKAIAAQQAVIDQHQLLYGPDGAETLDSMNTMGLIYQAAGDTHKAIREYNSIATRAPESSLLQFTSLSNLGTLLFSSGDLHGAEGVQTEAYKKAKINSGIIRPKECAIATFNLALTKRELGKREEALELMERALKQSQDAFGYNDPITRRINDTWEELRGSLKE